MVQVVPIKILSRWKIIIHEGLAKGVLGDEGACIHNNICDSNSVSYKVIHMIGLHQFLYLRFFNGKKKFPSKCPNNNLNIQGRVNPETTKNVKNWPACSEICRQREDCKYWISAKKISTGQYTKHSYDCITMSDYDRTNADGNTISGARDCQGG